MADSALQKPRCWAACLGDCDGLQTREHIVSRCLYPNNQIEIQGLEWCLKPTLIPIERLFKRILCRKHNAMLGEEVDHYAKYAADTIKAASDLFSLRHRLKGRRWRLQQFEIDASRLERWFIKTLINVNLLGSAAEYSHEDQYSAISPPPEFVEVAFGRRHFTGHQGLYMLLRQGENITLTEGWLQVAVRLDHLNRLIGADYKLWGMPFHLHLSQVPPQRGGVKIMPQGTNQWFETSDDKGRKVRSHRLTFTCPK